MRKLQRDIFRILSHGLAVIAVLLFVAPLSAEHAETRSDHSVEWSEAHSMADGHEDHSDEHDHSAGDGLQVHCDPGPDCSNSFAVINSISMTVVSSGFRRIVGGIVNVKSGRISKSDIPPPKHIS